MGQRWKRARPILLKPSRGAGFGRFAPIPNEARIGRESGAPGRAMQALGRACNGAGWVRTMWAGPPLRTTLAEAAEAPQNAECGTRKARRIREGESDATRVSESDASDSAKTLTWRGFQGVFSDSEWCPNPTHHRAQKTRAGG